ncbi:MAG: hypothetical protein V4629_07755 [Pseudomonadota bacterium]
MATIHINHPIDIHKTKTKLQTNQVDSDVGKNIQLQGTEFDQLVKKSVNNNNSHDPDSRHSAQQRSLSRYALRRQRIMQSSTSGNEENESPTEFQSHLKYEVHTDNNLINEKQVDENQKHSQQSMHKKEHFHKDENHYQKTDKNNFTAEALKVMEFENSEVLANKETRAANNLSDIANAWEEVISVVNANQLNGRTSVIMTLQSSVFFGSQIQITQTTDQLLLIELLLVNEQAMEMARSHLQELEINLKKRLDFNVKVVLQRRNAEELMNDPENSSLFQKDINETKDLWGDDSIDIPVVFDF